MNAIHTQIGFDSRHYALGEKSVSKQVLRLRLYGGLLALDCAALVVAFLLAALARTGSLFHGFGVEVALLTVPIYAGIALNSNAYSIDVLRNPIAGIMRALTSFLFTVATILFIAFFLRSTESISRLVLGLGTGGGILALTATRLAFARYAARITGGNPLNEMVIVDDVSFTPPPGAAVIEAALFNLRPNVNDPHMLDRLGAMIKDYDRVVVACSPERRHVWAMLLKGANVRGEVIASQYNEFGAIGFGSFEGHDTMLVSSGPLSMRSRAKKRVLDLALTVPVLLGLAPLLLVTALAIRLDSKGPVFFVQKRLGRGNRLFSMYKFRSMRSEMCDANGNQSTRRDDDRITRVGKFIRATSIDELPQLLNVLKGDMSLVGPRPHALGSLAGMQLFWEVDQRYWHRHASKPGITGLAQIRGYRGATHESIDLTNRLRADLEYLKDWTIWRDVSILLGTFKVLVHRNAY
ncbi:sugar transferase [Sphingomonas profundi]|uniref:sugar transferase n=1 Tax=Alterirhizorhabdus profundi TaxID=2681549 RepID=UPI001E32E211|nr:sugar transferase [Sphingomonas profundi]